MTPSNSAKKSSSDWSSPYPSFPLAASGSLMAANGSNPPFEVSRACTEAGLGLGLGLGASCLTIGFEGPPLAPPTELDIMEVKA